MQKRNLDQKWLDREVRDMIFQDVTQIENVEKIRERQGIGQ